jgi:hypothetical protein
LRSNKILWQGLPSLGKAPREQEFTIVSKREKKRSTREGADRLRAKPGWDPTTFRSERPEDALQNLNQDTRTQSAYGTECDLCRDLRRQNDDPTALCEVHLKEVLGF